MEQVEKKYTVSSHAAQRYVERAWGITNVTDQIKEVSERADEINKFLNKLCIYGACIYDGPIRQYKRTQVYRNDNWIVLVDPVKDHIITCYAVKLGLDEDFDNEYVNRMVERLNNAITNRTDVQNEVTVIRNNFSEMVKANDYKINEYKRMINQLEKSNKGYKEVIENCDSDLKAAQLAVEDTIDALTRRKVG